ncbi:MAG: alanine--tRNA ligase-related protein [Myxococcota bacterium]
MSERTERLELDAPHLLAFEAVVRRAESTDEGAVLVLDRSAFYPEGGGQLADQGVLYAGDAEVRVLDVQRHGDSVLHHTDAALAPGTRVRGHIDRPRRLEHMALHTGQHLLSRAFLDIARATTRSARLGSHAATLDLERKRIPDRLLRSIEERVNEVVDDDRPIHVRTVAQEAAPGLGLRRSPKVDGPVRIVEVEGFDRTPCGGTHCTRTAQVGPVKILEVHAHRGGLRVTFAAGRRARRVLFEESDALRGLAARFSCAPEDVPGGVAKLEGKLRESRESLRVAREGWAAALATRLAQTPEDPLVRLLEDLDREALRALASGLTREGGRVVALAAPEGDDLAVVLARGPGASLDCGAVLRALTKELGGGGGGRPERAEGRLPRNGSFEAQLRRALAER